MKKITVFVLSSFMAFSLCACGGSNNKDEEIAKLQAELNELKGETSTNSVVNDTVNTTDDIKEEVVEEEKVEMVSLTKGTMFTVKKEDDEAEVTINSVTIRKQIDTKSDNPYASYFPEQEGQKYIDVELTIKNIGGNKIGDEMFEDYHNAIVIQFDSKYNYTMQQLDIFNSAFTQYWSLEPLKTYELHWIALVPDEVTDKPYEITFTVGNETYSYKGM